MRGDSPEGGSWFRSRSGLILVAFLAIAGFFIVAEHTAHVLGVLPYLLLLACPLLHFVHGRHGGGHGGRGSHGGDSARRGEGEPR